MCLRVGSSSSLMVGMGQVGMSAVLDYLSAPRGYTHLAPKGSINSLDTHIWRHKACVTDQQGRFVGGADLYYASARLVVEYDGLNHRERLIQDNRRQNLILGAGYQLLRFTAADIRERRDAMVSQVRTALSAGVAVSARR